MKLQRVSSGIKGESMGYNIQGAALIEQDCR